MSIKPNNSILNYYNIWDFGDGSQSSAIDPTHTYNTNGLFDVSLIVKTDNGCIDTSIMQVQINEEFTFYAPTAITPMGKNPVFYVVGIGIDPDNFQMLIYDRWGEVIFETHEYDEQNPKSTGWDGRVKGRVMAPSGSYTWLVKYKDKNGTPREFAGPVTLIK